MPHQPGVLRSAQAATLLHAPYTCNALCVATAIKVLCAWGLQDTYLLSRVPGAEKDPWFGLQIKKQQGAKGVIRTCFASMVYTYIIQESLQRKNLSFDGLPCTNISGQKKHLEDLQDHLSTRPGRHELQREITQRRGHEATNPSLRSLCDIPGRIPDPTQHPCGSKDAAGRGEPQASDKKRTQEGREILAEVGMGPLGAVKLESVGVFLGLFLRRVRGRVRDAAGFAGIGSEHEMVGVDEERGRGRRQDVAVGEMLAGAASLDTHVPIQVRSSMWHLRILGRDLQCKGHFECFDDAVSTNVDRFMVR